MIKYHLNEFNQVVSETWVQFWHGLYPDWHTCSDAIERRNWIRNQGIEINDNTLKWETYKSPIELEDKIVVFIKMTEEQATLFYLTFKF